MSKIKILFGFLFLWSAAVAQPGNLQAHPISSLPRSTPEREGISSRAISAFLDSVANSTHEFHSFMLVRHGKVVAEGWWQPYEPNLKHTLYSLSKSFTATAVGFARAEGKLSLTDKVISFFPEDLPDSISPNLRQLSIKDLLIMSAGQEPDPTADAVQDSNWVRYFLAIPVRHQPGSRFLYNSMATYMLSAIVQKVTGQKLIEYLQPRLFGPLGIEGADWETDPKGITTGGWGLRLRTEDIAKFAQLFLQKGKWNGKQLLPQGWAEEASAAHIIQHPEYTRQQRESSDWEQGYGYQMWRCRNNAFRGDGAYGQYAIVMPDENAVIAITSETGNMQGILNLVWKVLLPAMQDKKLKHDPGANAAMKRKLNSLSLNIKKNQVVPAVQAAINGKTYTIQPNDHGIQSIALSFQNKVVRMNIKTDTANYTVHFDLEGWHLGETRMTGPYLLRSAKNNLKGLPPFKVAGEYTWLDANTLELILRHIESPHSQKFLCHFEHDKISIEVTPSIGAVRGNLIETLRGVMQ